MTQNQIAYQANLEQARSNRAREEETYRHNTVDEYNQLIGKLNNIFSLMAHAAGGSNNLTEGLAKQANNLTLDKGFLRTIYDTFNNKEGTGPIYKMIDRYQSDTDNLKDKVKNAKSKFLDFKHGLEEKINNIF